VLCIFRCNRLKGRNPRRCVLQGQLLMKPKYSHLTSGTRPSSVSNTSPLLSRSNLPTGNTRVPPSALNSSFRAYIIELFCDASIVHVTPRGLLYFRYTKPDPAAPRSASEACAKGSQSSRQGPRHRNIKRVRVSSSSLSRSHTRTHTHALQVMRARSR
jgi:hypothetical protein